MDTLRVAAAAQHLGISPATLRRLADSGYIHSYRYGTRERRFDVRDLDAWHRQELQPGKEASWPDDDEPEPMTTVYIDLDERWVWRVFRESDSYIPEGLTPVEVPESNISGWLAAERFYNNAQRAIKELWPDDPDKRQP